MTRPWLAWIWRLVWYTPDERVILAQYGARDAARHARRLLIAHLGADPKRLRVERGT
mgnify:FL=1